MSSASERGATAVTALLWWGACAACATVALIAVMQISLLRARAQDAADAAALAAAGATVLGPTPGSVYAAAKTAADLHGVELLACCGQADVLPPHIQVRVRVRLPAPARLVRAAVTAEASASLRP